MFVIMAVHITHEEGRKMYQSKYYVSNKHEFNSLKEHFVFFK